MENPTDTTKTGADSGLNLPYGSADEEAVKAWELYVFENHICRDSEEFETANYWHKLDTKNQEIYRQKIRDKQNA